MATRKPTDKCLLCEKRDATQKNSHIIPAALLKSMIGPRDKEISYVIDTSNASVDKYFGRDVNPTTEVKQHHYARDYYFCEECEKRMGTLESKMGPLLSDKLRDSKYSGNYRIKQGGGLTFKDLIRVDTNDFNVFFLSVIWRQAPDYWTFLQKA